MGVVVVGNTGCIGHPLLSQAPRGLQLRVGGGEDLKVGGRKRRQSTSLAAVVVAAGCAPGCAALPLGRERAELGVAARVVPSSRLLSGAELAAVEAAGRELSRSLRPEYGWRECGGAWCW